MANPFKNCAFFLEMSVRDYELDLLGMVNNGVYQGYLEHARHEYLKTLGLDFAGLHQAGYRLVVLRAELDYLQTLHSGDRFVVTVHLFQETKLRFCFEQAIFRMPDQTPVLKAKIIGTGLKINGRPGLPPQLLELFK